MKIKSMVKVCLASTMLIASSAFAESLSWQYLDIRYLQPSDDNTRGLSGEISGHITDNWILQAKVGRLDLKDNSVDLEMSQTRYDLIVGRVFSFNEKYAAFLSGGYTHLEYAIELGDFEEDEGDDAANIQLAFRGRFTGWLEGEAGIGMLFDDKDTSDLLWNASLRFWPTDTISFMIGANGVDSDNFTDDILYEVGLRFDLM